MMKIFTKLLVALVLLTTGVMAQTIRYVKIGGTGDGLGKWANATSNLQDAIDASSAGDQVWVALGTYYPSKKLIADGTSRDRTFILKEGVKVSGGFAGTETSFTRVVNNEGELANETILSGDFPTGEQEEDPVTKHEVDVVTLDGDGIVTGMTGNTTNAFHVVVSYNNTAETVLDGFTIEGGNANGSDAVTPETGYAITRNQGGGIFLRKSSASLINLIVRNNHATAVNSGAGILGYGGKQSLNPARTDVVVFDRIVILNNFGSNDVNSNSYNKAAGAGMFLTAESATYKSDYVLKDSKFIGNFAKGIGGGLRPANANITVELQKVSFVRNKASYGGALYLQGNTTPYRVLGCNFENNEATSQGGAINVNTDGNLFISNSKFFENESTSGGAIFSTNEANLDISNSVFAKNESTGTGGGITLSAASALIVNCTFFGNSSTTNGGALRLASSGTVSVKNTVMLENTGPAASTDVSRGGGTINISNSIRQLDASTGITHSGTTVNLTATAAEVFINTTDVNHSDFLKLIESNTNPAIDAGIDADYDITSFGSKDIRDYNRMHDFKKTVPLLNKIDLGAYEAIPLADVLPVKISSELVAKVQLTSVVLTWATATETNNKNFILERSIDGANFSVLTILPSKGDGAKYSYTDFSPVSGTSYYKLTQIDLDGTKVTFDPIAVNFSLQSEPFINIYPNPAVGSKIIINLTGNKFKLLEVVNLQGQVLQRIKIAETELEKEVDISRYSSGIYIIKLSDGENKVSKRIVKP